MYKPFLTFLLGASSLLTVAQTKDSLKNVQLQEVQIRGYKAIHGIGHLDDTQSPYIFAGKKTEVILTDSLDANKAINNTRQMLGRIPGLTIVETETGGFVSNGVGIRGLNPSQYLEMNVRQNGYTIATDVYGYNEVYYLPPMHAVERIEIVKGAASLQFGSQFGGQINYVLKSGPKDTPLEYSTMQTGGSFGLFNTYHSLGGTHRKISYFGYVQYRTLDGWRDHTGQQQLSGYGKLTYQANSRLKLGLEYSLLRNKIRMPGGLTDAQYEADPRASYRSRNWIKSPWNVLTASLDYTFSEQASVHIKTTGLLGERSLVWFDKAADVLDLPQPDGSYTNRTIEKRFAKSTSTEIRYQVHYKLGSQSHTLATGMRMAYASFKRLQGGAGTAGSDFDMHTDNYKKTIDFTTFNLAPFVENVFQLSPHLSVTPGVRLEYLRSSIKSILPESRTRTFLLGGIGLQYNWKNTTQLYANISQAYRPITYSELIPLGVSSQIDPNLKDAKGYTLDIGYRGLLAHVLTFDVGGFYMAYNNRIGLIEKEGQRYRTNVANSVHQGIESYLEADILKILRPGSSSHLRLFHSMAYIHARYTSGEFKGKSVAYAPEVVQRTGLTFARKGLSATAQWSRQSRAFSNAANTDIPSKDGITGILPAYTLLDLSATYHWKNLQFTGGINNLADTRYFTQRTDEYPGPGILPSIGRNFYIGIGGTFR